jgi:(p)ppGpp synthase/HD superfamily hydrolase
MLQKAISLAKKLHEGQFRKSGEPYVSHPLEVSNILKEHGFSEEVQTVGVLHDLCEDTGISNAEIERLFTQDIASALYALSKNKKPEKGTVPKNEKSADLRVGLYIRRFTSTSQKNPMVLYIKIADQIHNLSTMQAFSKEKKLRKIQEVEQYFLPVYMTSTVPESEQMNYSRLLRTLRKTLEGLQNAEQ